MAAAALRHSIRESESALLQIDTNNSTTSAGDLSLIGSEDGGGLGSSFGADSSSAIIDASSRGASRLRPSSHYSTVKMTRKIKQTLKEALASSQAASQALKDTLDETSVMLREIGTDARNHCAALEGTPPGTDQAE